jgi:multiple sugar transport system substrate-binding protein
MRRLLLLALFAVVSLAAATIAAGAGGESGSAKTPTLEFWVGPNSENTAADMTALLQPFTDATGIPVQVEVLDWASIFNYFSLPRAIDGWEPDLVQVQTSWTPYLASLGGFLDFSSRFPGGLRAFPKSVLRTTAIHSRLGIWAIPWLTDARLLYFRTDVLKKAGIKTKTAFANWASFRKTLQTINQAGVEIDGKVVAPFAMPGKDTWDVPAHVFPWIWASGGNELNAGLTRSTIANAASLRGVAFYTGLIRQGLVYAPALARPTTEVETLFANGTAATVVGGPWLVESASDPASVWDPAARRSFSTAPLSGGPSGKRFTYVGGSNLMALKSSAHLAEIWQLIKYLVRPSVQIQAMHRFGLLPSTIAGLKLAAKTNKRYGPFFSAITKDGRSLPNAPFWGEVESIFVQHLSNIFDLATGKTPGYSSSAIRAELKAAQDEANAVLSR